MLSLGLRILHGEHAGELLDACLEEICTEAIQWPQKRAFLIVPEQTKADMERRYLEVRSRVDAREGKSPADSSNALMLVDVVSFHRFAHRILSEVGGYPQNFLDSSSKSMLIHQILSDGKEDFKVLSALSDRMGFVPDIENVLGDFSRYHVTAEKLHSIRDENLDPQFFDKMTDFALLMERLAVRQCELGLSDQGEEMKCLSDTLRELLSCREDPMAWPLSRLSYMRDASVWIMGFGQTRDFTPQEWDILELLYGLCAKLTISVCADRVPSDRSGISDGSDVFYFGRQTLFHLLETFPLRLLCEIAQPQPREPSLSYLSCVYSKRCRDSFEGDSSAVRRVFAKNSMDELHFVAGEIKRLVLLEGFRYNDISVVLCDRPGYESNLHAVFREYGLDPFLDKRRPLSGTVLVRFVLSLLDLGIEGWSFRPLMACLKSGMCHITADDADRLENYCLEHGLFKGFRIFSKAFYDEKYYPGGEYAWCIVERVLFPIRDFVRKLSKVKSCAGKADELLTFLLAYGGQTEGFLPGVAGQVEALSREWTDAKDQEAALALVSSFNELVKLLEKLEGPIGEMGISLLNFKSMLSAGMDATLSGAIPSYVDQLQISDTRRGYQRSCKVLFLVGAKSDNFPFKTIKEGFLRGFERELLSQTLSISFPSRAKDQVYVDTFTAYALLSCPAERLYMTCPSAVNPSSVFALIPDVLPGAVTIDRPENAGHDPRLFSKTALQRFVWSGLSGSVPENSPDHGLALLLVQKFPELAIPSLQKPRPFDVILPPEKIDLRYDAVVKMSVSQIESYAACPFKHFSQYVLGLKERKVFQVAVNDIGSFLHRMFEISLLDYHTQVIQAESLAEKEEVYHKFLNTDYEKWAVQLFKTVSLENTTPISRDEGYMGNAGSKIIRVAQHSLRAIFRGISPREFEPDKMEWSFGADQGAQLALLLPSGRTIQFRGVIDRVDLNHTDRSFRIIDYKSGNKKIDYNLLYSGLSLQLPAYVYAYRKENPDWNPADAGYFYLTAPMVAIPDLCGRPAKETLENRIDKEYSLRSVNLNAGDLELSGEYAIRKMYDHCRSLFSGDFSVAPRVTAAKTAKPACEYCEYSPVCGIDPSHPPCLVLPPIPVVMKEDNKRAAVKDAYTEGIRGILTQEGGEPV